MILDIIFDNSEPIQIQNARVTAVYPQSGILGAELMILHYFDGKEVMKSIPLFHITEIRITND